MSEKLYKLGKWAFAHRWLVLAAWIAVLAVFGMLAGTLSKPYSTAISIPGTKAQAALDTLSRTLPAASNGTGTIVFAAPKGHVVQEEAATINSLLVHVAQVHDVGSVVSPFTAKTISQDGRIAFATIQLSVGSQDVSTATQNNIIRLVKDSNSSSLEVEVRGDVVATRPSEDSTEGIGVAVAALVLAITFGSIIAAGMPLLIAIMSIGLGTLIITAANGILTLSSTTPVLAIMLGLAVGIDYSLFLITRYKKFLLGGLEPQEAAGRAIATAGNAVIFAALTVIIALSALCVVKIPFLSAMGIFAALTVVFAAAAAITLVPALLGFAKYKVMSKKELARITKHKISDQPLEERQSLGHRWVDAVVRRPVVVLLVTIIGLGALALPATKLYLGLPSDGTAAKASTERKAYDLLSEGFGAGFNGPLLVVANLPRGLSPAQQRSRLATIASNIKKDKGIAISVPVGVGPNGRTGIIQAYPTTGPDDKNTRDLIIRLRDDASQMAGTKASIAITGETAISVDINSKLAAALPLYLLVVVGLSLLVLIAVFRSVLVPIKATLGFLLTILATLGVIVMVFQWGWFGIVEPAPVLSFLPILATGILFGLGMDYQFFLVSGMREEYTRHKRENPAKAVVDGFTHGAKVVTAAAIIMISVFSGFILSNDTTTRSVGFALAVGVLIDAFIVRMTIVPAVMALFGHNAWWLPAWLGKLIPNLSIEGEDVIFASKPRIKIE